MLSASTLALGLSLAAVAPSPAGSLETASRELADKAAAHLGGDRRVAVAVLSPDAEALAAPVEAVVADVLARRGPSVIPLRGAQRADPEGAARQLGCDHLVRIQVALSTDGDRELLLAAEVLPTWQSFFLQRVPARPPGAAVVTARVRADREVLLLAKAPVPPSSGPFRVSVRPLLKLDATVLALAVGDVLGDGRAAIAVVSPHGLALVQNGRVVARREVPELPAGRAPRDPTAAIAIGDFGGGRIAYFLAGANNGEVIAVEGGSLRPVGVLSAAPICAGAAGKLFGHFVPGRGTIADTLAPYIDPKEIRAIPAKGRELVGVAATPRPSRIAYAALYSDGALIPLGQDLKPAFSPVASVGAGFALADLDGDGVPELVASSGTPGPTDRIRVLRFGGGKEPEVAFESGPIAGALLAGGAGDLDGDGRDDAVLAAPLPDGTTQLYLVTREP